ncbi:17076_t:CDS:1, partial [Gigaspora rosea]
MAMVKWRRRNSNSEMVTAKWRRRNGNSEMAKWGNNETAKQKTRK